MTRSLLCLPLVVSPLCGWQSCYGLPPDQVANSPVPSHVQSQKEAKQDPATTGKSLLVRLPKKPHLPKRAANRADASDADAQAAQIYGTEPVELWSSSEMIEARAFIVQFCQRSKHTSPEEGEKFLDRLAQLSPDEMSRWLKQFQTRRQKISRGHEVGKLARLVQVDRSLSHLQARKQATQNVAELRRQAAAARELSRGTQRFGYQLVAIPIDVSGMSALSYNPMEVVIDPSSPRGYGRKVAAAMSLPGDLPRSDPRNYIRGEAGVDFGQWATTKNAVPPALSPPDSLAQPAPSE